MHIEETPSITNCKVFKPRHGDKKCPVIYVLHLFSKYEFKQYYLVNISQQEKKSFPSVFKDRFITKDLPERIFLFAHQVTPSWWEETNESYDMIFAHVCEGATELFNNENTPFKDWVSYTRVVKLAWGDPRFDAFWKRIFIGISEILKEISLDSLSIKEKIKYIYEMELESLDEGDPLDDILISLINNMNDSIVSKN